ncbi:lysine-specific demethylase PHF2 [Crotalus adamanteus]|uniref:Lysine-specific demethylase PHF2 n=1 Tax=Crotalus adamanteus TaxID=8729 RepID=A0AAW1BXF3_CROAD
MSFEKVYWDMFVLQARLIRLPVAAKEERIERAPQQRGSRSKTPCLPASFRCLAGWLGWLTLPHGSLALGSSVVLKGANMATVPVYCICRLPYDVTRFMIECDACKDWFHGRAEIPFFSLGAFRLFGSPGQERRESERQRRDGGLLAAASALCSFPTGLFGEEEEEEEPLSPRAYTMDSPPPSRGSGVKGLRVVVAVKERAIVLYSGRDGGRAGERAD